MLNVTLTNEELAVLFQCDGSDNIISTRYSNTVVAVERFLTRTPSGFPRRSLVPVRQ